MVSGTVAAHDIQGQKLFTFPLEDSYNWVPIKLKALGKQVATWCDTILGKKEIKTIEFFV